MATATSAQTSKGDFSLETGFSPFVEGLQLVPNTGFNYFSTNTVTLWSIGAEGGLFIAYDLLLKLGAGYLGLMGMDIFHTKWVPNTI